MSNVGSSTPGRPAVKEDVAGDNDRTNRDGLTNGDGAANANDGNGANEPQPQGSVRRRVNARRRERARRVLRTNIQQAVALWVVGTIIGLLVLWLVATHVVAWRVLPPNGSDRSNDINNVLLLFTALAIPVFMMVIVFSGYSVFRYGSRRMPERAGPAVVVRPRFQLIWIIISTALVLFLFGYGLFFLQEVDARPATGTLIVKVVGEQWMWNYAYPQYHNISTTTLELPVGRTVVFSITSLDVQHSFWIPAFGIKQDAVPYETTTSTVTTEKQGSYYVQCADLVPGIAIFLFIPFVGMGLQNSTGRGVQAGWTVYGPIADQTGMGMTALAVAVILAGTSSILGAVNVVTTVMTMRAPGMRWTRLPMSVWGITGAAIIAATGAASFTLDLLMILCDRIFNTSFFYAATGGNAVGAGGGNAWLSQNLFWFFGHPEVYLIVLPSFGIVMDLYSVFTRKPLYGYRTAILGILGVVILSFLVWQHHEFVSGWAPEIRPFYMLTTELISVPTGLIFLVAIGTLWRGRIWLTMPMMFALSFLWNFVIGGLTGIYLSDVPINEQLHGNMFVVAHFHYTIVGGALMGFFAAVYYWYPKMFGRMLDNRLGWIHFWGTQIGFNGAFMAIFRVGLQGMPRRVADYDPALAGGNLVASLFAFLLIASIVVFFFNVAISWRVGRIAEANPWGALSLEWQTPTPVPLENFEKIPVVTSGPYNYGEPTPATTPATTPGIERHMVGSAKRRIPSQTRRNCAGGCCSTSSQTSSLECSSSCHTSGSVRITPLGAGFPFATCPCQIPPSATYCSC